MTFRRWGLLPLVSVLLIASAVGWWLSIPAGPPVERVTFSEPGQLRQRQQIFYDQLATQPQVLIGWHVPPEPAPDHEALLVVERILAGGEASRLYDRMVRTDGTTLSVSSELLGHRGPDMLVVEATSRGAAPEVLRDAVIAVVQELRESGATAAEVEAARQQIIRDRIFQVESNLRRALTIGFDTLFFDEPGRINGDLERIRAVTVDDVNAAFGRYLDPGRADVMLIRALGGDGP